MMHNNMMQNNMMHHNGSRNKTESSRTSRMSTSRTSRKINSDADNRANRTENRNKKKTKARKEFPRPLPPPLPLPSDPLSCLSEDCQTESQQEFNSPLKSFSRGDQARLELWNRAINSFLLIADTSLEILYSSSPTPLTLTSKDLERAQPIYFRDEIIGYLFLGGAYRTSLNPKAQKFLNQFSFTLFMLSTLFLALILITVPLILKKLLRPLDKLKEKAREIEAGDYGNKIEVKSRNEMGELIQSMNQMSQTLHDQERSREQFLSDIAHELRTPLTLLKGELEMFLDGELEPSQERLEILNQEVLTLEELASSIRHAHENLEKPPEFEKLSLDQFVRQVINSYQTKMVQKGSLIRYKNETQHDTVLGNKIELKRVFNNLLDNALRYATEIDIEIQERKREGVSSYYISIKDNGIGIAPEELPHIFKRFYRVDASRHRNDGGQGLGLFIAQKIARRHGGNLRAEESSNGALFVLTLPIAPSEESEF